MNIYRWVVVAMVFLGASRGVFSFGEITDATREQEVVKTIGPGGDLDLCVTLPDGAPRKVGADTDQLFALKLSGVVYAKRHNSASWPAACIVPAGDDDDNTTCEGVKGVFFRNSSFDLEAAGAHSQRACWRVENHTFFAVDARFRLNYVFRVVANGFVLNYFELSGKSPILSSVKAATVCLIAGSRVRAFFTNDLKPSRGFLIQRGDVVEVSNSLSGNALGLPNGCLQENEAPTARIRVERIYPFQQPAVYKTTIEGIVTNAPLTDKNELLGQEEAH